MRWGWEQLAALAGILAVALWIVGIAISESTNLPDRDQPVEILTWYDQDSSTILASGFVFQLGALAFLIFMTALRSRLWWTEGGSGFLTTLAYAAGVAVSIFLLAMPAADMSGALNEGDLTPQAAQALNSIPDIFFIGAELSAALLLIAVGLLAILLRALPKWLGWVSLLLALWLLIPPIGWAGLLLGVPLWTVLVSVLLWMRPAGEPVVARPPDTRI